MRLLPAVILLTTACVASPPPAPAPAPSTAPAASAPSITPPRTTPAPAPTVVERAAPLPAIPDVRGPLKLDVVYPVEEHLMTVRDSTFLFGSTGNGQAALTINGAQVKVQPNGAFMAFLPVPSNGQYALSASVPSGETASMTRRIRFPDRNAPRAPSPSIDTVGFPRTVVLRNTNVDAVSDTDIVTVVRPVPGGTYKWLLMPGTVVHATAVQGDWTRIKLDDQLEGWVEKGGTEPSDATVPRTRTIGDGRVTTGAGYTDVVFPISARVPYEVSGAGAHVSVIFHGALANISLFNYATRDPAVELVRWEQQTRDRVRFDIDLRQPLVGWMMLWRGNAMVLRLRHLPKIDINQPLRGRVIAVDPGHPPIGSTGPTRLREPEATLAVSQWVKRFLEEAGATVVMLRTTMDDVALGARPIAARRANAEAFVSVHLNAFADGANPYARERGSGTYYFHPQSEPLARFVQRGLVERMGLRDEGIFFDNLAVARASWFPSVLCEGAWVVMPEQEAALRTPEFQQRYARGIVDGLARYFASLVDR